MSGVQRLGICSFAYNITFIVLEQAITFTFPVGSSRLEVACAVRKTRPTCMRKEKAEIFRTLLIGTAAHQILLVNVNIIQKIIN